MNQNILVPVLTLLFYLTSVLGGGQAPLDPSLAPQTPSRLHDKSVLGYYVMDSASYNSLIQNSNHLTGVAPWSWGLDSYGNLNADFDPEMLGQVLKFAGTRKIETYALIHNMFNGRFDQRVVKALLDSEIARARAISQIRSAAAEWGLTGINLDLESVPPSHRQALTDFVAELSSALREDGVKVTMAVPAKTADNPQHGHSGAYDYQGLGKHVDQLVIMAYDQHYRTGPAGPVAAADWVEAVVKYAVSQVPAGKIVLGIPNYGYDWPQAGTANALTYEQTMQLAAREGASLKWHNQYKVPYFTYGSGRQVWFENRYSIKYKLELVKQYNLNGIALWRLGQEDPGIWNVINNTFS